VVTCANSFHHYPNQVRAVAEMHRVLKPGGRLFLLDGFRDSLWGWLIYDVCVAAAEGAVRHVSARETRDLFRGVGFAQTVQTAFHRPAPFLLTEGVVGPYAIAPRLRPYVGAVNPILTGVASS
jgi:SAM-dependent methyltransferase